jgi:copper chaperone CopZ
METIKVKVNGMMCMHCAMHVENGLKTVKGVKKVTVDLAKGEATIEAKAPLSDDDLKKAIADAGYEFAGRI